MKRGVVWVLPLVALQASAGELHFATNYSGVTKRLNAVVYGGNSFVIVGTNSVALASALGNNAWRSNSVPPNGLPPNGLDLKAVTYGSGKFVAGGDNDKVFWSTDGITWSNAGNAFDAPSRMVKGLAFNAGTFVAVAQSALIRWVDAELPPPWTWNNAANANPAPGLAEGYSGVTRLGMNGFALCGRGGVVRVSTDGGRNWVGAINYVSGAPTLLGIASDGTHKLVCVGEGGRIMVSANDGATWAISTSGTTSSLNGVSYTGTEFIAVGNGGLILSSSDGTSWTSKSSPPTTKNLFGVAFATSGFLEDVGVLVGDSGTVILAGEKPAAPTNPVNQTVCADATIPALSVSVSDSTRVTVDWYAAETEGTPLPSGIGTTIFTPPNKVTATYYAQSRDLRTGFISTNRTGVTLTVNPLPAVQAVTGGGPYCSGGAGVAVGLNGSQLNVSYQLRREGADVGSPVSGTGGAITFGQQTEPGTYTVTATTNATGCQQAMSGSASVSVNPLPAVQAVTGGGPYCSGGAGVAVGLNGSQLNVSYQLRREGADVGSPVSGTGGAITFGQQTEPGTYTVTATTNATGCQQAMSGSALVSVNPLPAVQAVTGGGPYCSGGAGVAVGLNGSQLNVSYQLRREGADVGSPVSGTGGAITFGQQTEPGTYTVTATTNATGCQQAMSGSASVSVNPLPAVQAVTGGGPYCSGGAGVAVGLNGSQLNVSYQLRREGADVGSPVSGTGGAITFGQQTVPGTYTVTATTNATGCQQAMSGSALVSVNPLPAVTPVVDQGPYCNMNPGAAINFTGPVAGTTFSWVSSVDVGFGTSGTTNIPAYTATNLTEAPVTAMVTVTPSADGCAGPPINFGVTVNPTSPVDCVANRTHCNGEMAPEIVFSGSEGATFSWNSSVDVGFGTRGTNNIPAYNATNLTEAPITALVTVTPTVDGNVAPPIVFTVTVLNSDCHLTITLDYGNAIVQWTGPLSLQSTPALSSNSVWTTITTGTNGVNIWTNAVEPPPMNHFFRLIWP